MLNQTNEAIDASISTAEPTEDDELLQLQVPYKEAGLLAGDGLQMALEIRRVVTAISRALNRVTDDHELPNRDDIIVATVAASSVARAEDADRYLREIFGAGGEAVHSALNLFWQDLITGHFRALGLDGRNRGLGDDVDNADVRAAEKKAATAYRDAVKRAAEILADQTVIPAIERHVKRQAERAKRQKTGDVAIARIAAQAQKSAAAAAADGEKLAAAIGETRPYDGGNMRHEYVRTLEDFAKQCAILSQQRAGR